ncbi:hypothetical protein [Clostridium kluyveri]|uniref:Uncharacterized protein n=1 Tax=Clostridium kluyveri TaxID=1534 RepID=A0A1L5F2T3_CLOKL|nr:hypothetical protein [Clostridium kluyveri]APM37315.1 hypothetical protein BS101_00310 [Clostridium kluyveri]
MDKNEMLKILLDKLESMTDDEVIKHYEEDGIRVTNYAPGSIGKVCLYDYDLDDDAREPIFCGCITNSETVNEKFSGAVSQSGNMLFFETIKSTELNKLLELESYDVYYIYNKEEDAA